MGNFVSIKGFSAVSITPNITPPTLAVVSGESQLLGVAQALRLMLSDRRTGLLLRHLVTTDTGHYELNVEATYINTKNLLLIAFDDTGENNAAVVDHIEAESV